MNYTVYNSLTGEILELISISNPDMIDTILQGNSYVEGHYNATAYYIDQAQAVEKPLSPSHDYIQYTFDWPTKSWIVDSESTIQYIKQQRNTLLSDIDRVNPIRYASLVQEQQQALIAYRQALLDVPQQAGFPTDIVWPAKPTWL